MFISYDVYGSTIYYCIADYTDQAWDYSVGGNKNDIYYTPKRYKSTDSSVYCKVSKFSEKRKTGDVLRAIIVDGDKDEFSKSFMKTMDRKTEYEIANYAYEDTHGCDVRIKFWSRDWRPFYTWTASGVWSPDCYGSFN